MPIGADEFRRQGPSIKHSSGALGFAPASPESGSVRQYITGVKSRGENKGVTSEEQALFIKKKGKENPLYFVGQRS